jgi:formylglycine-generating enzyme required for sulfatase activity
MKRREFLRSALAGAAWTAVGGSRVATGGTEAFRFEPERPIIPAPRDPAAWPEFRRRLTDWRVAKRRELNYRDASYRRAEFKWASANFTCVFLMLGDAGLYDAHRGRFKVRPFLEQQRHEFGGADSVVLWHAYPRIGLDDRNQFDFYRDLPGGLPGLRRLVAEFQRADVRVFVDYNPWDTGTRREGRSDLDVLGELVRTIDADGIFLDTLDRGGAGFRAKLDAVRPGVVLEGEDALPLNHVEDHHCSWAQWFDDSEVPGVLRNKWFERRHQQHQIKRWDYDHSGELQAAWMNGSGMMVWENVFGSWVGWNERDKSWLRLMQPVQHRFADLFCGEHWTPLVPTLQPAVFASLWEGRGLRLWTLVNRSQQTIEGPLLALEPRSDGQVFDLIAGRAARTSETRAGVVLNGSVPPRGLGCFVTGNVRDLGADFTTFLRSQRSAHARISSDTRYPRRATTLRRPPPVPRHRLPPAGMVEIPAATLTLNVEFRERECGFYESAPPTDHQMGASHDFHLRRFERRVSIRRLAMDVAPVTNAQFARFLLATGYRPRHPEHFLRHWTAGAPPTGHEDHPVVYVDLDDARAYARWAGRRLPTEEEWQYAAQGPSGGRHERYPWGEAMLPGHCNGGESGGTTPVQAFPQGASPFGVLDLCGNVWEWTESERSDGRTRFCLLKGGSFYTAEGSGWYMDGGPRPNPFVEKFLLMWPGVDRCATIGFRCVAELEDAASGPAAPARTT